MLAKSMIINCCLMYLVINIKAILGKEV